MENFSNISGLKGTPAAVEVGDLKPLLATLKRDVTVARTFYNQSNTNVQQLQDEHRQAKREGKLPTPLQYQRRRTACDRSLGTRRETAATLAILVPLYRKVLKLWSQKGRATEGSIPDTSLFRYAMDNLTLNRPLHQYSEITKVKALVGIVAEHPAVFGELMFVAPSAIADPAPLSAPPSAVFKRALLRKIEATTDFTPAEIAYLRSQVL